MSGRELFHYGVKGQRWGVRNGPPYPIEDKVMKKGTRLNSVSVDYDPEHYRKSGRIMYTYNPNDSWDSSVYKGPFSVYKINSTGGTPFEHQYEVVKDLKMPTKKERYDEYVNLYKKNVKTFTNDLQRVQDVVKDYSMGPDMVKAQKMDLKNVKTDEDYREAYKLFNHAMEYIDAFKSTQLYTEIMSTKYDAMVDDNNQGTYNNAHDPVMIFNAKEALKTVENSKMLTVPEILMNYSYVKGELAKEGKRVKL